MQDCDVNLEVVKVSLFLQIAAVSCYYVVVFDFILVVEMIKSLVKGIVGKVRHHPV